MQIVNGVTLQHKNATMALTWVQATRFVLERVLRERLLATYSNVQLRCGSWVSGIEHGGGNAQGSVTGTDARSWTRLRFETRCNASGSALVHRCAMRAQPGAMSLSQMARHVP